jgi:hypothetical protein
MYQYIIAIDDAGSTRKRSELRSWFQIGNLASILRIAWRAVRSRTGHAPGGLREFSAETTQRGIQPEHDFNRHPDLGFADSHAAAIKQTVIRVEKTMGVVKAYLQLKAVTATKQMASAHAMLRTRAKVSAGSPPSSHANTAANKRNTEKKSPNALKKSQ